MFNFQKINIFTIKTELFSGLTSALALIPEVIAFSVVAGTSPLTAIYTSFFLCLITSLIGGRPGMISGAAGSVAIVVTALVVRYGVEYLFLAVILMGIIQIVIGALKLGKFIRLVPQPVVFGFLNGLAIVIFLSQFNQFYTDSGQLLSGMNMVFMISLVVIAMIIIYILPKFTKAVPSSLVAIVVVTLLSLVIAVPTKTIGDLSSIAGGLPQFHIPMVPVNLETISIVLPYSIVMALVGLIESLLTLEVVDEMTNTRGKPNRETYAQGIANTICGFFSGMGGCAMIGQSIVNINSGGRHRLSGIISAITLLCIVLFASPVVNIIPMAALVGVMFMVSFNTFKWESFKLVHNVPNIDVVVMVVVTLVTVIFDNLALAVILGVVISALSFAWENSKRITAIVSYDKEHDVKYYEIQGPLFFGSTSSFKELFDYDGDPDSVVINFSQSRVMDHSAIDIINEVTAKYAKRGKKVLLSYLSRDSADLLDNAEGLIEVNYLDDPYYRIPHDELD